HRLPPHSLLFLLHRSRRGPCRGHRFPECAPDALSNLHQSLASRCRFLSHLRSPSSIGRSNLRIIRRSNTPCHPFVLSSAPCVFYLSFRPVSFGAPSCDPRHQRESISLELTQPP